MHREKLAGLTSSLFYVRLCVVMKLLISLTDQSFLATKSIGIFNVSMGLVRGFLACDAVRELHILCNDECGDELAALACDKLHLHLTDKPVPSRFKRIIWDQFGVQKAIRAIDPDWCILPKGFPPFKPALGRTKLACYVHDFNWEYYENKAIAKESPFPRHEMIYFSTLGKRALEVADLILTSTQFNRERFLSYYDKARIAVVGIGFDGEALPAPQVQGKDILAYVSPFPHKRSDLAIPFLQVWLSQRADAEQLRIHLVGKLPEHISPQGSQWVQHERIPFAELQRMLREDCRLSVYFSDYEGYGMPPVESLRLGIPTLASDLPPIRENIPAQYLFSNDNINDFTEKLNKLYDDATLQDIPSYPSWKEVAERCVRAMVQDN